MAQERPKSREERPKSDLERPKSGQEKLKGEPELRRWAQERPRRAQDDPRFPQGRSKTPQTLPAPSPNASQEAPRSLQPRPPRPFPHPPQMHPKRLQDRSTHKAPRRYKSDKAVNSAEDFPYKYKDQAPRAHNCPECERISSYPFVRHESKDCQEHPAWRREHSRAIFSAHESQYIKQL